MLRCDKTDQVRPGGVLHIFWQVVCNCSLFICIKFLRFFVTPKIANCCDVLFLIVLSVLSDEREFYWRIWLPLVDDLIAPSSEIIKYFGWKNKIQNMAILEK